MPGASGQCSYKRRSLIDAGGSEARVLINDGRLLEVLRYTKLKRTQK